MMFTSFMNHDALVSTSRNVLELLLLTDIIQVILTQLILTKPSKQ